MVLRGDKTLGLTGAVIVAAGANFVEAALPGADPFAFVTGRRAVEEATDPVPLVAGLRALVLTKGRSVVLVTLSDAVPLAVGLLVMVLAPKVTLLTGAVAGRVPLNLVGGLTVDPTLLLSDFRGFPVSEDVVEVFVAILVLLIPRRAVLGRGAADLFAP